MSDLTVAGDIGGTNSRFQLFCVKRSSTFESGKCAPGDLLFEKTYKNSEYSSFTHIMKTLWADCEIGKNGRASPDIVCLAVAGPVTENSATLTNRGWVISGSELEKELGSKFELINDFVGQGYGLLTLNPHEYETLQSNPIVPGQPIACIGAGTGLGEVYLTPLPCGFYQAWPSEGGHAEYAPRNDEQCEMLTFLKKKFEQKHRVSVERVVSGTGILNVYEFLAQRHASQVASGIGAEVHAKVVKARDAGGEAGGIIAGHASKPKTDPQYDQLCDHAMELMMAAYGSEAGVAALKWLPFGGLYITGGVTSKNMSRLQGDDSSFMQGLRDKGRLSPVVERVCVRAVNAEDIGLRGAHYSSFKYLRLISHPSPELAAASPTTTTATSSSAQCSSGKGVCVGGLVSALAAAVVVGYVLGKRSV